MKFGSIGFSLYVCSIIINNDTMTQRHNDTQSHQATDTVATPLELLTELYYASKRYDGDSILMYSSLLSSYGVSTSIINKVLMFSRFEIEDLEGTINHLLGE